MSKNICLSLAFMLLACAPVNSFAQVPEMSSIIELIARAKKDIMMEIKTALILKEKAEKYFQDIFQDTYAAKKQACLDVLQIIASSSEFTSTLEKVTNEQVILITKDMVAYNDIIINPSAYPLEEKVDAELSLAAFNAQEGELFNIFYVIFAIVTGSKMLIEKLEIVEKGFYNEQENIAQQ